MAGDPKERKVTCILKNLISYFEIIAKSHDIARNRTERSKGFYGVCVYRHVGVITEGRG